MAKYGKYEGQFICHECKGDVPNARFWYDTYDLTWMCDCGKVSKVNLYVRGY